MLSPQAEIQLVACTVAAACSLSGVFLILRRMAMMSDVISHAILPGIVIAFFITHDITSPFLVIGAALTGVVTVALVELLSATRLVREDASMGLVFPALFSVGVILIARHAGRVHLDTDAVLLGEIAFAPFNRLLLFGYDLGPKSLWVMGAILVLNLALILALYKELKLATFDGALAAALGFSPLVLHYLLMGMVSVTAVGAFDAVGSILVVALMIAPPASAFLMTYRLGVLMVLSVLYGIASAVSGYWLAYGLDASIAGSMATMAGVFFFATYLAAPHRGLIAVFLRRRRQRWEFAEKMLAIHLLNHEHSPDAALECHPDHLEEHLRWDSRFAGRVVRQAARNGYLRRGEDRLVLTPMGRSLAREAIVD